MMELAFVACLVAEPATCEDRAMQFADMSTMACMTGAQPQLASRQSEHPGSAIRRWTCRSVGTGLSA